MSIAALIQHVRDNGFDITIDDKGPRLRPVTAKPVISRETVDELKEHRQAIIDYITAEQSPKPLPTMPQPQSSWVKCRQCQAGVDPKVMTAMVGLCPMPAKCPYRERSKRN